MIEVKSNDNGHTAWCWGRRLGVACMCGHRALLELEKLGAHKGDMKYLYDRKFLCSKCDRRMVQLWFMTCDADETDFLMPANVDPFGPKDGGRP